MKTYNWQQSDWPNFRYDLTGIEDRLFSIAEKMGLLSGKLTHLTEDLQTEALINILVEEAIKTSEIEGEHLNRPDVRSSIKNKLGLNPIWIPIKDQRAQGIAELMLDARNTFKQPLTKNQLLNWHLMLLASSRNPHLQIGQWRSDPEPMQIVSKKQGRWIVYFEAPPAINVPKEMQRFIRWFNHTAPHQSEAIKLPPVRSAIAHLYFESIHPFEDGNGRIGRAIAEKALSQGFGYPTLLSLSQTIEADKKSYYTALHTASQSNEITDWIEYFVSMIYQSQLSVEKQINFILKKSVYFDFFKAILNDRQLKVIQRMMDSGIQGFAGGMSAKKYMAITKTSKATSTRDLQDLVNQGALKQQGSGRSVRYELNLSHSPQR